MDPFVDLPSLLTASEYQVHTLICRLSISTTTWGALPDLLHSGGSRVRVGFRGLQPPLPKFILSSATQLHTRAWHISCWLWIAANKLYKWPTTNSEPHRQCTAVSGSPKTWCELWIIYCKPIIKCVVLLSCSSWRLHILHSYMCLAVLEICIRTKVGLGKWLHTTDTINLH